MTYVSTNVHDYAIVVQREVLRLVKRHRHQDAGDIAQKVVVTFLADPEPVMAARPDPVVYARAAWRNAMIGFDRTDAAQRGSGSRRRLNADGTTEPGRRVVSGDMVIGDGDTTVFDLIVDTGEDLESIVVDGAERREHLERCLLGLPSADRTVLYMVRGEGYEVKEAAHWAGVRPETMSRRLARSMKTARTQAARTTPTTAAR